MKKNIVVMILSFLVSIVLYGQSKVIIEITSSSEMKIAGSILVIGEKNVYLEEFSRQLIKDLDYSDWIDPKKLNFKENFEKDAEIDSAFSKDNASILIVCKANEKFQIDVYDTIEKSLIFTFTVDKNVSAEYLAHNVCDEIIYRLTGKPGIARSKILYITKKNNLHSIVMADYDGSNPKDIFSSQYIINFPRWFPGMKKIVFLSYRKTFPSLDIIDLKTNQIETFLAEPGLNACISFFKNQEMAAVVLSRSGNPDIYIIDFNGKIIRRLTEKQGINASPSVSPDGRNIAFVSDRDGKTRLWLMNPLGFNCRKIDIPSNYVTSPCWSPDGRFLAYAVRYGTEMFIEVYDWNTNKRKILTQGISWSDAPSWAPDSRHIVFTRQDKYIKSLWTVDLYTLKTRKISDNAWSACWDIR